MIRVIKPGFFTTVQDEGRTGHQQYGVIVGGAMDSVAYRLGNALLKQRNGAALEMTLIGGTFMFTKATTIALTGGVMRPTLNGQCIPMNKAISINEGDVLACGPILKGARSYLFVVGGIDVPLMMNSRSTLLSANIGGYKGRALKVGDELPYIEHFRQNSRSLLNVKAFYEEAPIRIITGTEWSKFSKSVQEKFLHNSYEISLQANRMGYRLIPAKVIKLTDPFQLISEAVTFGTVQMPPNGEPIILMADRQTTGGYPKIAQVIAADLHRLAQLSPTQKFTFEAVNITQAEQSYMELENEIRKLEIILSNLS